MLARADWSSSSTLVGESHCFSPCKIASLQLDTMDWFVLPACPAWGLSILEEQEWISLALDQPKAVGKVTPTCVFFLCIKVMFFPFCLPHFILFYTVVSVQLTGICALEGSHCSRCSLPPMAMSCWDAYPNRLDLCCGMCVWCVCVCLCVFSSGIVKCWLFLLTEWYWQGFCQVSPSNPSDRKNCKTVFATGTCSPGMGERKKEAGNPQLRAMLTVFWPEFCNQRGEKDWNGGNNFLNWLKSLSVYTQETTTWKLWCRKASDIFTKI